MAMRNIKNEDQVRSYLTFISADYAGDLSNGEAPEARVVKRRKGDTLVSALHNNQRIDQIPGQNAATSTVKRSSRFRGVSKHKWTGRYEAHLWDKLSWNVSRQKKGKQVYLGAYDDEEASARAYDLAALKYWGASTLTNFPISDYEQELEIMQTVTKEEYLGCLRRKSSGFSRGVSKYRGVARHHHNGRWEAMIARVSGNKYLYLGTYGTQEEAARAYDIAAIEHRGINAVTNFDQHTYISRLKPSHHNTPSPDEKVTSIQSEHTSLSFISGKELKLACLQTKAFRTNGQTKQESSGRNIELNSYKKSTSPTALDLLLRSSVFRELVEKNSNVSEDESDGDDNTMNMEKVSSTGGYRFYDMPTWGMVPIC